VNPYERRQFERDMRRQILAVDDVKTQDILFSLLGYVHELAEELERTRQP
jgi:hypothetical protein